MRYRVLQSIYVYETFLAAHVKIYIVNRKDEIGDFLFLQFEILFQKNNSQFVIFLNMDFLLIFMLVCQCDVENCN